MDRVRPLPLKVLRIEGQAVRAAAFHVLLLVLQGFVHRTDILVEVVFFQKTDYEENEILLQFV